MLLLSWWISGLLVSIPPGEACEIPNPSSIEAIQQQASIQEIKASFQEVFPSLQEFDQGFPEFQNSLPSHIAQRLNQIRANQPNIESLATEYANLIYTFDSLKTRARALAEEFYTQNGWETDHRPDAYQALLQEATQKQLRAIPEIERQWNEARELHIQRALFAYLDQNPQSRFEDLRAQGFLTGSVTEDKLRLWINGYYAGPIFVQLLSAAREDGEWLLLPEEVHNPSLTPEERADYQEYQNATLPAWNQRLQNAIQQLEQANERFGPVADTRAVRERVEALRLRTRALSLLQSPASRQSQNRFLVNPDYVSRLGISNYLQADEVESFILQSESEKIIKDLRRFTTQIAVDLGNARILQATQVQHHQDRLVTDWNIKNRWEQLEALSAAYPGRLDIPAIRQQMNQYFLQQAKLQEISAWIEHRAWNQSKAWIVEQARTKGYLEVLSEDLILAQAAEASMSQHLKNYFEERSQLGQQIPALQSLNGTGFLPLNARDSSAIQTQMQQLLTEHQRRYDSISQREAQRLPGHFSPTQFQEELKARDNFQAAMRWLQFNSTKPWAEIREQMESLGAFRFMSEEEVRSLVARQRAAPLIQQLFNLYTDFSFRQIETVAYNQQRRPIVEQLRQIETEYPGHFSYDRLLDDLSTHSREMTRLYREQMTQLQAEELEKLKEESHRNFFEKMWDVSMDVGEAGHIFFVAPIAGAASLVVNQDVSWGADYINWVRGYAEKHHQGSILGNDEQFMRNPIGLSLLSSIPIVQAGNYFEPVIGVMNEGYDEYVKWVNDYSNEDLRWARENDPFIRWGYRSLAVGQTAAAGAVILSTGGAGAMSRSGSSALSRASRIPGLSRAGRLASNPQAALWAGQAVNLGRTMSVAVGLGGTTAVGYELYYSGLDNRDFDFGQVADDTLFATGQTMLFMGGMSVLSRRLTAGHMQRLRMDPARAQVARARGGYRHYANQRAALQVGMLDLMEGAASMPQSIQLFYDGDMTDLRQLIGASLVTGANLWDMRDVGDALKGMDFTGRPAPSVLNSNPQPNAGSPTP